MAHRPRFRGGRGGRATKQQERCCTYARRNAPAAGGCGPAKGSRDDMAGERGRQNGAVPPVPPVWPGQARGGSLVVPLAVLVLLVYVSGGPTQRGVEHCVGDRG